MTLRLPDLAGDECRARVETAMREDWEPDARLRRIWRAEGGFSNETWFADVEVRGRARTVVVRRQALIGPLEPYDLAREAAILRALTDSEVPVPEVHLLREDPELVGSPFVVMERVEGEVPEYRNLPEYPPWADAANRTAMAREMLRTLARIQRVPLGADAVAEGVEASAPGGEAPPLAATPEAAAQTDPPVVGRVRRILGTLDEKVGADAVPPVLRDAAAWLIEHAPPPGPRVLVHGDFKVGNFIWRGNEIAAVLDWELSTVGDPLEDVGYACHPVMRARRPELMAMLVPFDEWRALYERELGTELDLQRLHYHVVYALYFHLYTFVTGLDAGLRGADVRVALAYPKFPLGTRELIAHMRAYEDGDHAL